MTEPAQPPEIPGAAALRMLMDRFCAYWKNQEEANETPAPPMNEKETIQALDIARTLLQNAATRAQLQGDEEREYLMLQGATGMSVVELQQFALHGSFAEFQCQTGAGKTPDWNEALIDAMYDAEIEEEAARMVIWLDQNTSSDWHQERKQDTWNVSAHGCPHSCDARERFWSSHEGRLFDVAVNIAKNIARAQAASHRHVTGDDDSRSRAATPTRTAEQRLTPQPARVKTGAAPVKNINRYAPLAAPSDEEERGQSEAEFFLLLLDKALKR